MQYDTDLLQLLCGRASSLELLPGVTLAVDRTRLVLRTTTHQLLLAPYEQQLDTVYALAHQMITPYPSQSSHAN